MDKVRVLIADDNVPFRWSLMEALLGQKGLEIVEEASDGIEAVEKASALKPDVVVMDLYMPNCDGVEATRQLQSKAPDTRVLIFTVSEADADLVRALKAGARGYMLKDEKAEQVAQAIHYVARGGILVSPAMAAKLLKEFKGQEPPAAAAIAGTRAQRPPQTVAAAEVKGPAVAEAAPSQAPQAAAPAPAAATHARDDLVSDVHLVLSPPLEPASVLSLHLWLTEVAKGDVQSVSAAWGGDTVMAVDFREPVRLLGMLEQLPEVAQVAEEPYAGEAPRPAAEATSQPEHRAGAQRPPPKQYRLMLKGR